MFLAVQGVDDRTWWPLVFMVALLVYVWFAERQRKLIKAGIAEQAQSTEVIRNENRAAIADERLLQSQMLDELKAIRNLLEKRS